MKDNTAAVHAQVPVGWPPSCAKNVKKLPRSSCASVHVILIPNRSLETPNYRLERLKYDDPRLDNLTASYQMVAEPEDEAVVTHRRQELRRQTPVIKASCKTSCGEPVPAPVHGCWQHRKVSWT